MVEIHGISVTIPFLDGCRILRRCWDVTGLPQLPLIRAFRKALPSMKWKAPFFPEPSVSISVRKSELKMVFRVLRVGRKLVKESCDRK